MKIHWKQHISIMLLCTLLSSVFGLVLTGGNKASATTAPITADELQVGDYVQMEEVIFRSMGGRRLVSLEFVGSGAFDDYPNSDPNIPHSAAGYNSFGEDDRRGGEPSSVNMYLNDTWKLDALGNVQSFLDGEVDLVTLEEYNSLTIFNSDEQGNINGFWWLKTADIGTSYNVYYGYGSGSLSLMYANYSGAKIRPVITLKQEIQFRGAGTSNAPYTIIQPLSVEMFPIGDQNLAKYKDGSEIYTIISGTASPIRSTGVSVEGTLGGITKRTNVINGKWFLYWTNKELLEGGYTNITLTVQDEVEGIHTREYNVNITVGNSPSESSPLPVITVINASPFATLLYDPTKAYVGNFEIIYSDEITGVLEGIRVNENGEPDENGRYTKLNGTLYDLPEESITEVTLPNGQKLHVKQKDAITLDASFQLQFKE